MVLMSRTKRRCPTGRDRECFFVEDALYRHATRAGTICLQVTLIPRHTKWLVRELDHEEIVAGAGGKPTYTDFHRIIQRVRRDCHSALRLWKAGSDVRGRYQTKSERAEWGIRLAIGLLQENWRGLRHQRLWRS